MTFLKLTSARRGRVRRLGSLVAVASVAAVLLVAVPAAHADSVPGQQPGDVLVHPEPDRSAVGFSYNGRAVPGGCPNAAGPCNPGNGSRDFTVVSRTIVNDGQSTRIVVQNVRSNDETLTFHDNAYLATSASYTKYFNATSHGYAFVNTLLSQTQTGSGQDYVTCGARATCTLLYSLDDDHGELLGGKYVAAQWDVYDKQGNPIDNGGQDIALPAATPLAAAFTATQAEPAKSPGEYQFVSSSTSPNGDALGYAWGFGDGATSRNGATVTHTYAKPGTYHATLTVTASNGDTDSVTHDVVVAAPELSVQTSIIGPKGSANVRPGDTVHVDVEVSAGNGVGDLSQVAWDKATPGGVSTDPPDEITVTTPPTTSLPSTLEPTDDVLLHYTLTAGKALGTFPLTSTVDAIDAAGAGVTKSSSTNLVVSNHAIKVAVTPATDNLVLKSDDAGNPVPQTVDVTVAVTNTSDQPVDDVVLGPLELADADPDHPSDPFPLHVVGENKEHALATIQPGQTVPVVVPVQVTGDGSFALSDLETSDDGAVLGQGSWTIGLKTLLAVRLDGAPTRTVRAGGTVVLTGSYKNVSEDRTVVLTEPSRVIRSGNLLGGGYIAADTNAGASPNYPAPLTGTIKPGGTLDFRVTFTTAVPTPADYENNTADDPSWTRGTVSFSFAPRAAVAEDDGTYSSLTTADPSTGRYPGSIKISGGSNGTFAINVDTARPSAATFLDRAAPAAFGFTIGSLQGAEAKMTDLLTLFLDGAQAAGLPFSNAYYSSSTYLSLQAAGKIDQLHDALNYLSDLAVWSTNADLDDLTTSVADNVHSAFTKVAGNIVVDGKLQDAVPGTTALKKQADAYVAHLQAAWDNDDPNALVEAIRPAGVVAGGTATDFLVQEAVLQGVLNGLRAGGPLYTTAARRWQDSRTITQMEKTLPSAAEQTIELKAAKFSKSRYPLLEQAYLDARPLSDTELGVGTANNGAGMSQATIDALRKWTSDNPDTMAATIPNEANVAELRNTGQAVDKIENVKPKSMATLEYDVFGGRPADLNCVVLRNLGRTWDDAKVNARMDQLIAAGTATEDDRNVALQILHDREGEWATFQARGVPERVDGQYVIKDGKYVAKRDAHGHIVQDADGIGRLSTYDEAGAIPNAFRGADNGLNVSTQTQYIPFKLDYLQSGDGYAAVKPANSDYIVLRQQNPANGQLVKITGDDDGIFIGYRNGLGLRPTEINEAYSSLTTVFNHPFSDTWLAGVDKKLKIFSKYMTIVPGTDVEGAPLIAWLNGQAYAVKINPYLTRFDGAANRAFIKFDGLPAAADPSPAISAFRKAVTQPAQVGPLPARFLQLFLHQPGAADNPRTIPNARTARIVRIDTDGKLEAWTPDTGWQLDPADQARAENGQLAVAPQTVASGSTAPGDVELAISTQADNLMTGPWFDIGDEVVIDPGGPDQETATISAFGSLIFRHGLRRAHHAGEIVGLLRAAPVRTSSTSTTPATPAHGLSTTGLVGLPGQLLAGELLLGTGAVLAVGAFRRRRRTHGDPGSTSTPTESS